MEIQSNKSHSKERKITKFLLVGLLILLNTLIWKQTLSYFFTGTDGYTITETGRIQSPKDIIRIFSEPLGNGTEFVEIVQYYRPITTLSYGIDYALWKLNPFGYHLTDLILHTVVSIFVFFLIKSLINGNLITAFLGAFIFSTHPILVESVPVIARRQDILAAFFLLPSLLLFIKYEAHGLKRKLILYLSLVLYILAVGAKEMSYIMPFLIFSYLMISTFAEENSFKSKIQKSLVVSIPYFSVTIILLIWRTFVLKGILENADKSVGLLKTVQSNIIIFKGYFEDLAYPANFLIQLLNGLPAIIEKIISLIFLCLIIASLIFFKDSLAKIVDHNKKSIRIIQRLLLIIFLTSLACIFIYPLLAPFINQLIQQAYYQKGPKIFIDIMMDKQTLPVSFYFFRAKHLALAMFAVPLIFSMLSLIGLKLFRRKKNLVYARMIFFLLIWILLPLGLYIVGGVYSHWHIYLSLIPFSIILSLMISENLRSIKLRFITPHRWPIRVPFFSLNRSEYISFIILLMLLVSLILYSPLIRTYEEWAKSGEYSSLFLEKLISVVDRIPENSTIYIHNFPSDIYSYRTKIPHIKSPVILKSWSIKSWIDFHYPENEIKVIMLNKSRPEFFPYCFNLDVKMKKENVVAIYVRFYD